MPDFASFPVACENQANEVVTTIWPWNRVKRLTRLVGSRADVCSQTNFASVRMFSSRAYRSPVRVFRAGFDIEFDTLAFALVCFALFSLHFCLNADGGFVTIYGAIRVLA